MAYTLVMTTCPEKENARRIAYELIEAKLAACVHILPEGRSVYSWKGKVQEDKEYTLLIKTDDDAYSKVESMIQHAHPYELPEIIAVPISTGLSGYLRWIGETLQS